MKAMPSEIKQKLRQLQKASTKVKNLEHEVERMFEEYNINTDYLRACGDYGDIQTEGLTFVSNAEGDVETNINLIEEIFLYYVNKDK